MKNIFFALLCLTLPFAAKAQTATADEVCGLCKHPIGDAFEETPLQHAARAKALEDWNPQYVIDFLAVFDPNAVEWAIKKCGSLEAYGEHVVENMNYVMRNSELNGKFRLVGTFEVDDNVTDIVGGPSYMYSNGKLKAELKRTKADVCLLFSGKQYAGNSTAGNAFYNAPPGMGFGCVTVDGGYNTMTAIHEVGHIMGCAHARDVDLNNEHPYNAGAMRWIDGQQYSTVMGYHGTLLPHFSSPNYIYKGTAMGSETEDCCRRITERLPDIVHLGDPTYEYNISENPKTVNSSQQYVTLTAHTFTFFTVSTDDKWISLEQQHIYYDLEFDATINFRVEANYTDTPREGRITITPWEEGYEPFDIIVRQYCQNGVFVDPTSLKTHGEAQELTLDISAEKSTFNFVLPEDESIEWLTIRNENRSGNGSRTVPIQLAANTTGKTRTCNVTVYGGSINGPSVTVPITQAPADFGFECSTKSLEFDSRDEKTSINLFAGSTFTTEADAWIHVESSANVGDCVLTVRVEENTSEKVRNGNIHLATTDGKHTLDIPVNQSAPTSYVLSETAWDAHCGAQSKTFTLTTSTYWQVEVDDKSWISVSPMKGEGSAEIKVSITQNEKSKPRWNTVRISGDPSCEPVKIAIEQASYTTDVNAVIVTQDPASTVMYDLFGRPVSHHSHGVYVKDGKKIIR